MRARNLICFLLVFALIMPTVILLSTNTAYAFDGLAFDSNIFRILQGVLAIFLLGRFTDTEQADSGTQTGGNDQSVSGEKPSLQEEVDLIEEEKEEIKENNGGDYVSIIERSDWTQMEVRSLTRDEEEMLNLVNKVRIDKGLDPLKVDFDLVQVARVKSQDMIDEDYFSHFSPNYGSPFDMMRELNISYYIAGENIAGAPNVALAHENLMNSPSHRDNILHSEYTHIGVGIIDGGRYGKMFSQEFARLR
ncbi:CAP domain-containing protein [Halonatronum saccharophilum]|uniref:CAP domain-containing protein n=1 Tax=Halonatronum saccharophilum TaxID=150060 RepID=UPI0004B53D93|nr:CAP domain-containing protein [Halonatronum saccharophilum]